MDLKIAPERILLLKDEHSAEGIEAKAILRKMDAFGTINKITGIFSRPAEDDFEIVYREHRYQPFWHIASTATYVYDRNSSYQHEVPGKEVQSITLQGKDYDVTNGHLHFPVVEHCRQTLAEEVLLDAVTGSKDSSLQNYLSKIAEKTTSGALAKLVGKDAIIVPPQIRVSGIFREMLSRMIQGIQADQIFEEKIEVTCIDLYYHPVYAFQFHWKSKDLKAILEIDAITGATSTGTKTFREFIGKTLDQDFLFDIGADAAGLLIPGGSIAMKTARKIMEKRGK